jgi:hypothetical protein
MTTIDYITRLTMTSCSAIEDANTQFKPLKAVITVETNKAVAALPTIMH